MVDEERRHVFISYVHEDSAEVNHLCAALETAHIPYWRDRKDLGPGDAWRAKIRAAIKVGSLVFLACFSNNSRAKEESYMNEELTLAAEEFRKMPPDRVWLIPVRFDPGDVPYWDLGAGRSLEDLNFSDLFGDDHSAQLQRLVATIHRLLDDAGPDPATPLAVAEQATAPDRVDPPLRELSKSQHGTQRIGAESDSDRTYELLESSAILSRSASNPSACDMQYRARRRVRGYAEEGIRTIAIDFTRDTELMLPFDGTNRPNLTLSKETRTGGGRLVLARPRKTTGSSFVQDVEFLPPLRVDEVADFTVDTVLRAYKFAYLEDLVSSTIGSPLGVREFEMFSRNIAYPTALLIMKIFLPDDIHAIPIGPKVGRSNRMNDPEGAALMSSGAYREWAGQQGGRVGVFMELRVHEPTLNRKYRLAWALPRRNE